MKKDKFNRLENDCLVILAEVARRRGEPQTYNKISEWTGVPLTTVRVILSWSSKPDNAQQNDMLYKVAKRFGYDYLIIRKPKKIIDVIYRGLVYG